MQNWNRGPLDYINCVTLARRDMSDFRIFPLFHTIAYNMTVAIVVHLKRGLEYSNAHIFCVYTESSIFLYIYVIHAYTYRVGGRICCSFMEKGLQFMYTICLKG